MRLENYVTNNVFLYLDEKKKKEKGKRKKNGKKQVTFSVHVFCSIYALYATQNRHHLPYFTITIFYFCQLFSFILYTFYHSHFNCNCNHVQNANIQVYSQFLIHRYYYTIISIKMLVSVCLRLYGLYMYIVCITIYLVRLHSKLGAEEMQKTEK